LRFPLRTELVIFDIDGTLADAFGMIAGCFNAVMESLNRPTKSVKEVRRLVGTGSRELLAPFVPRDRLDGALELFYRRYDHRYLEETHPMPNALELLEELHQKEIKIAAASNKRGIHCRGGLDRLGMLRYMELCVGAGDITNLKPDPDMIHKILKETAVASKDAVMVGDSPIDVATAHAAGLPCVAVSTGSHTRLELEEAGADRVFCGLKELLGNFEKKNPLAAAR